MRVLAVATGYPPQDMGGTAVHLRQLAQALMARGHEVAVFCRDGESNRPDYAIDRRTEGGVPIVAINYNFGDATSLQWIYENRRIEQAFVKELESYAPDVVHVHHLTCLSTTVLDAIKEAGIPLVLTLHDHWMVCGRGQRIDGDLNICETLDREKCVPCLKGVWPHFEITQSVLEGWGQTLMARMNRADVVITPSEFHRERMVEAGLDAQRVIAVPHGLDHDLIPRSAVRRFPPKRVGFIGSLLPSKGVHILVEALNRLDNQSLECHIHGECLPFHGDTSYLVRLKEQARNGLHFEFHGRYRQEDLGEILSGLDLLVVPSLWWETFCLTIREAMLAGVPVVASDLGAMAEALRSIDSRLLFRPGDPNDLQRAMSLLATDEEFYRNASTLRGRVRTVQEMAEDTVAIYRRAQGDLSTSGRSIEVSSRRHGKGQGGEPYATVFVPTWNGGSLWRRVLDRVMNQATDFDYEVLVIDSGSKDETLEITRSYPEVRLIQIPNSEFNHGLTRNRGVLEARGEIVALLTQDAEPLDENWLQTLVSNFDDPSVSGAYCHQLPRDDCNPFQKDRLRGWTRGQGEPERKRLDSKEGWDSLTPWERYRLIAFDDVASCVRKSVMSELPFERRQFGEDIAWAKTAILAGSTLVMDPRSVVVHSHNNPIFYEFKRVYLDHQNIHKLVGLRTIPTFKQALLCTVKGTGDLVKAVWRDDRNVFSKLWWTAKTPLYSLGQNMGQYFGARSAIEGTESGFLGWLDRKLRKGV